MNPNWQRWLRASVNKHFDSFKGDTYLYIEGINERPNNLLSYAELRMDGPNYTEICKGYWYCYLEVNILVQSILSPDRYALERMIGNFTVAFTNTVYVYKYGDGVEDTGGLLSCLQLQQNIGEREKIQVSYFGIVNPATKLQQATVEGHYVMYLTV